MFGANIIKLNYETEPPMRPVRCLDAASLDHAALHTDDPRRSPRPGPARDRAGGSPPRPLHPPAQGASALRVPRHLCAPKPFFFFFFFF